MDMAVYREQRSHFTLSTVESMAQAKSSNPCQWRSSLCLRSKAEIYKSLSLEKKIFIEPYRRILVSLYSLASFYHNDAGLQKSDFDLLSW